MPKMKRPDALTGANGAVENSDTNSAVSTISARCRQARLVSCSDVPGFPWIVGVPVSDQRSAGLYAALTHDNGVSWPDRAGQALARGVLNRGGGVALLFATLGDALRCHSELAGGRAI